MVSLCVTGKVICGLREKAVFAVDLLACAEAKNKAFLRTSEVLRADDRCACRPSILAGVPVLPPCDQGQRELPASKRAFDEGAKHEHRASHSYPPG
jgi:hypothetical protein